MNVRLKYVWVVQRANSNKTYGVTRAGIVTPHRYLTCGAPDNLLSVSTVGRRVYRFRVALEQFHIFGFNKCV